MKSTMISTSRTIIYKCPDTGTIVEQLTSGLWVMTNPRLITVAYKSPTASRLITVAYKSPTASSNPARWVRQIIKARKISADKFVVRSKAIYDEALEAKALMDELEPKLPY